MALHWSIGLFTDAQQYIGKHLEFLAKYRCLLKGTPFQILMRLIQHYTTCQFFLIVAHSIGVIRIKIERHTNENSGTSFLFNFILYSSFLTVNRLLAMFSLNFSFLQILPDKFLNVLQDSIPHMTILASRNPAVATFRSQNE